MPFPTCFIIFAICLRAAMSLFTSSSERAAPGRDPPTPLHRDDVRHPPLLRRHREDDRLDARELPLVEVEPLELLAQPGTSFRTPCSGPIRRIIR